jgi:hypothetical protein
VEGELTFAGTDVRSDRIADAVSRQMEKIWGSPCEVYRMVSDSADPILINEINKFDGMNFVPVQKLNSLEAMLNEFRVMVSQGKLAVSPTCVKTILDLNGAVWDKNRKALNRDPFNHHFDHLMSLVYLTRVLSPNENPIPPDYMVDGVRIINVDFDRRPGVTEAGKALEQAFPGGHRYASR